jgi:hypothetical protein
MRVVPETFTPVTAVWVAYIEGTPATGATAVKSALCRL